MIRRASMLAPLALALTLLPVGALYAGNGGGGPDHDERWREEARGPERGEYPGRGGYEEDAEWAERDRERWAEERELREEYERERAELRREYEEELAEREYERERYERPREYGREPYDRPRDYARGPGVAGGGVNIPPGHLPPPGECRIWSVGLPPGQQPPPVPCERIHPGDIGRGEVIVDHSGAYDPYGGWEEYEEYGGERPDTLPQEIFDIFEEMQRRGMI